ncbi:ClpP/crotonase [Fomitiporia mediterranea MF3/22]|uniref:ClpP/crotonase n=1 Tax=Fomitiporia mediterranea (strain MF3/22) TaxID=694068 RepID=UPI000440903E|nr:ClpP/crotonase [Fomitiporia mediterranea MF3/22]EJD03408.1 ClpP/crotonase [Fomitiporia mediterranea MF3/22]
MSATRTLVSRTLASSSRRLPSHCAPVIRASLSALSRTCPTSISRGLQLRPMSSSSSSSWATQTSSNPFTNIIPSSPSEGVALITLNRPKALNALNGALISELNNALESIEQDDSVKAVVITGSERAFAAGADIKEMKDREYHDVSRDDFLANWHRLADLRKPTIAAVSGYALGGGCELAMMCDIILASPTAVFGQPEIDLGIIPGAGGTQRLTRLIGQSRAMEIILTGRKIDASEAEKWGLVTRIVPEGKNVVDEAVEVASAISQKGAIAVRAAKECVRKASELGVREGLVFERRAFHALFATKDQKEGMSAFVEKRKPKFSNL